MNTPAVATMSEFARIAGFKRSYVTELRHAQRLVLTEDGKKVRVAESLALIESTRDPAYAAVAARHAATRAAADVPAPAPPGAALEPGGAADDDGDEPKPGTPYATYRSEKERWLAAGAKRDYEVSMRELIPAKEVEASVAHIGTQLRKDLEHLPDVLAPQLAPIDDEVKIRRVIADAIERALEEVSRAMASLTRKEGAHG